MGRSLLLASVVAIFPASAFVYIGSGFRSEAAYRAHLEKEKAAEIARRTDAIRLAPATPRPTMPVAPSTPGTTKKIKPSPTMTGAIELDPGSLGRTSGGDRRCWC
jgi:hypothetical protein